MAVSKVLGLHQIKKQTVATTARSVTTSALSALENLSPLELTHDVKRGFRNVQDNVQVLFDGWKVDERCIVSCCIPVIPWINSLQSLMLLIPSTCANSPHIYRLPPSLTFSHLLPTCCPPAAHMLPTYCPLACYALSGCP